MNKHTAFARISLLFASILGSINIASGDWFITDGEIDNASASVSIPANSSQSGKAVCYIKETGIYYTSLDKALEVAHGNDKDDTIYVIPGLKKSSGDILPVEITGTRYLDKEDTLNLPYEGETYYKGSVHGSIDGDDANYYFADQIVSTYRKTQVVLKGTFNVYGKINIGGVLDKNKWPLTGQTTGAYCEITMTNGSKLNCLGGEINCYGYIKRYSSGNGSNDPLITIGDSDSSDSVRHGKLFTPFVIYDFKGGTYTKAVVGLNDSNKFCPFQVFDFCNIQVKTQIEAGSYWRTRACLYGKVLGILAYLPIDNLYFIGPEPTSDEDASEPALVLKEGNIQVEYKPKSIEEMTLEAGDKCIINPSKTCININGTVDIGSIAVKTSFGDIDTSKFFFPISYKFDFVINKNSVLNVSKKVKFMNGSSLRVNSGATVNLASSFIVYDGETEGKKYEDTSTGMSWHYPSGLGSATLVNNGTINVKSGGAIGGYINVSESGANLDYGTSDYVVASPEVSSWTESTETLDVAFHSETARGLLTSDGTNFSDGNITASNESNYVSVSYNGQCGWKYTKKGIVITKVAESQDGSCGSITLEASVSGVDNPSFEWELSGNYEGVSIVNPDTGEVTTTGSKIKIINSSIERKEGVVVKATRNGIEGTQTYDLEARIWKISSLSITVNGTSSGKNGQVTEIVSTKGTHNYYSTTNYKSSANFETSITVNEPTNFNTKNATYYSYMTVGVGISAYTATINEQDILPKNRIDTADQTNAALSLKIAVNITDFVVGQKINNAYIQIALMVTTKIDDNNKQNLPLDASLNTNGTIKNAIILKFYLNNVGATSKDYMVKDSA